METKIKEFFSLLKGLNYVVTGSYALKKQGVLVRNIKDLDIIPIDLKVFRLISHKSTGHDFEVCGPNHGRYFMPNNITVDVFDKDNIRFIEVEETDKNGETFALKVQPLEDIYLQKLSDLNKSVSSGIRSDKIMGDLISYFTIKAEERFVI